MQIPEFQSHPWHGIDQPSDFPKSVNAFIEMVPADTVKFEVDKKSGFLKIDRPQKYSNFIPALYGFIPKTYCNQAVAKLSSTHTHNSIIHGDHDPLDICVITERAIHCGNIIARAIPIGGFRLIDNSEVDDKIIAVLKDDAVYGDIQDVHDLPKNLVERLNHYFLTYKNIPGHENTIVIESLYGQALAWEVIGASVQDYQAMIK